MQLVKSSLSKRTSLANSYRLRVSTLAIFAIFSSLLLAIATVPMAQASTVPICESSMSASAAGLKAVPGHGKVFYIDSGVTPKVDASYVAYKIQNSSGSTKVNLWVSLSDFSGGKVSLANPSDQYQQIESITTGTSKTVFYLLKALGSSTSSQQHTVKVFDRRPDLVGASVLLECTYKFTQVRETIKANSNEITSVTGALSGGSARLGGTLQVTVNGRTGKVGSGTSSPDGSIFWASPAAFSNWPTRSLRLESTNIVLKCRSIADITLVDELAQQSANTCFTNPADTWSGTYVFRIIGPGPSSLTPSPVAQLASGTQIKHSDVSSLTFASAIDLSGVLTSTFRVSVSASSTLIAQTAETATVQYTVIASTTSATNVKFDEFVVDPDNSMTLVTSPSPTINSVDASPVYLSSESGQSSPPIHWIGPFTINSSSTSTLSFRMEIPCAASSSSYLTIAYAKLGDLVLGYDSTSLQAASVTTSSSGGSCSATTSTVTSTISPIAQTQPATLITSSSATLNGNTNAYGASGLNAIFRYSTDPNLVNNVTTTAQQSVTGDSTTLKSQAITGLSPSTIYYFRIEVNDVLGVILSFTTEAIQAIPTVTTDAASGLGATSATLNGSINPNLTAVTQVRFTFSLASDLSSPINCATSGGAVLYCVVQTETGDNTTGDLTLSGSGTSQVSYSLSSLSTGTTYYFRVSAICAVNATYCPGGEVQGNIRQFRTGSPEPTTAEATSIGESTATLNGSIRVPSGVTNADWKFAYCAAGAGCDSTQVTGGTETALLPAGDTTYLTADAVTTTTQGITGLTGNTLYYFQLLGTVAGTTVSFGEILSFRTILITTTSLSNGTNGSSYSAGVVGAGGSNSYSFSATGLPNGLTVSNVGLISGTPTLGGTFNTTFTMNDLVNGTSTQKVLSILIKSTVTYLPNGGSGTAPTQASLAQEETFTVAANTFSRSGFVFAGWNDGTETKTAGSSYTMGTANLTFTAQWSVETYTISYNKNSVDATGSNPAEPSTVENGTIVTVLANTYTRTDYTFLGWNTASNGSGQNLNPGETFTATANTTLFARWQGVGFLSVTYNLNGGVGTTPTQADVTSGTAITIKGPATDSFSKTGHQFLNWSTGTTPSTVSPGDTFTVTTNLTLTANWQIETRTVTYFPNGVDVTGNVPTSTPQNYNTSYTVLGNVATPSLSRSGYTFNSWNTNSGGTGTTYTFGETLTLVANLELYAKWTGQSFTISYDANGGSGTTFSTSFTLPSEGTIANNGFTRDGYRFLRWNTVSTGSGGSPYSAGDKYSSPSNLDLFAIWEQISSGGGGGGSGSSGGGGGTTEITPVTPSGPPPPPPPVISSLSRTVVCAISNEITIFGSYLSGATVKLDGTSVVVKEGNSNSLLITLPTGTVGIKAITVTTEDGSATATINYSTANKPKFLPIRMPYLSQGVEVDLDFEAENSSSFRLIGKLPAGLTLNASSGKISGVPFENGIFVFDLAAIGPCGETMTFVELDVDAPTPNAMSHRINFLPGSCQMSDSARASFEAFILKIKGISPRNIIPDIFISGGSKNSDPNSPIATCRQESLCDLLLIEDLTGDILTDVFTGSENRIEIIVYWSRPNDGL